MRSIRQSKWQTILSMVTAILMLALVGCGENDPDGDPDADVPTIPPAYTLAPDFSGMGGSSAAGRFVDQTAPAGDLKQPPSAGVDDAAIQPGCSHSNYNHAALQVGFWNTALWVTLAVPTLSFVEAFDHDPVQQDGGAWVWSYDVSIAGSVYTAELYGEWVDDAVQWQMYVSKQGAYADFLWYRGTSNLPATEGTWTLKNNPTDNADWIGIEWSRDVAGETWQVQYMNILSGDPNEGGLIEYGVTGNETYNAFYDICNAAGDNCVYVESNTTSTAGRVMHIAHFGDDQWRYWDEDHCDPQP